MQRREGFEQFWWRTFKETILSCLIENRPVVTEAMSFEVVSILALAAILCSGAE